MIPYKYTTNEQNEIMKSMTVLIDTREKKNEHITKYFNNKQISYSFRKLDFGDYSFKIPANEKLGIARDMYFNDKLAIERKANLDELSSNFTHNRTQFENELIRSNGARLILMIENQGSYNDILKHNYSTEYNPKSFIGTLHAFKHRYNMDTVFLNIGAAGNFIYYSCYYFLREMLK